MTQYMSAKEFRQRLSEITEDLKKSGEIVVLKRSKPLFKIVPLEEDPSDVLNHSSTAQDSSQPDLQEISRIVHELRGIK